MIEIGLTKDSKIYASKLGGKIIVQAGNGENSELLTEKIINEFKTKKFIYLGVCNQNKIQKSKKESFTIDISDLENFDDFISIISNFRQDYLFSHFPHIYIFLPQKKQLQNKITSYFLNFFLDTGILIKYDFSLFLEEIFIPRQWWNLYFNLLAVNIFVKIAYLNINLSEFVENDRIEQIYIQKNSLKPKKLKNLSPIEVELLNLKPNQLMYFNPLGQVKILELISLKLNIFIDFCRFLEEKQIISCSDLIKLISLGASLILDNSLVNNFVIERIIDSVNKYIIL
jgi:hypothetical protein